MRRKPKHATGIPRERTNRSGLVLWYSGGNLILQTLLPKLLTFAALGMLVLAGCNEDKILTGSLEVNFSFSKLDGYAFPQVVLGVSTKPGETATYQWLAPTSGTYPQGIILPPGRYQATGQAHLLRDKYSPASQVVREFTIVAQ